MSKQPKTTAAAEPELKRPLPAHQSFFKESDKLVPPNDRVQSVEYFGDGKIKCVVFFQPPQNFNS
jgi:hypothetical protein